MADISKEKHRQRVREAYLKQSFESMPDHNVLELILFYAIPRKDVKPIAYALLNTFGSLENVLCADIQELMRVDGIGDSAAILINLFSNVNRRVFNNRNHSKKKLTNTPETQEYVTNVLSGLQKERMILISLANNLDIINCHSVAEGTVNCAKLEPRTIVELAIRDNASSVILAHNHPKGEHQPSSQDERFTKSISGTLHPVGIKLHDHLIVGENGTFSMRSDFKYINMFK